MTDYNRELFGEIDRFIQIEIGGKSYQVPDRLELLRVFQFLDFTIDYARLCWNGSCKRCIVSFTQKGQSHEAMSKRCIVSFTQKGQSHEAMSCRLRSAEGMSIKKMPPTIKPLESHETTESSE